MIASKSKFNLIVLVTLLLMEVTQIHLEEITTVTYDIKG